MGLGVGMMRMLAQWIRAYELTGPAISLGRLELLATAAEVEEVVQGQRGASSTPVAGIASPAAETARLRIFPAHPWVAGEAYFRHLGIPRLDVLEAWQDRSVTVVHDLNRPLPRRLCGRYGLVLDGGTLEHQFDLRTTWENIARLARVGGAVLHVSPISGWLNHGYFQPSPNLFFDFYRANGFRVAEALLMRHSTTSGRNASFAPYVHTNSRVPQAEQQRPTSLVLLAIKERELGELQLPVQAKRRPRPGQATAPATLRVRRSA